MQWLLHFIIILFVDITYSNYHEESRELILCRKCGADVADSSYIITKNSPGAHKTLRHNLFGQNNITIQQLTNPFGITFDILTIEKAKCQHVGHRQGADSWFPEHTWRLCACPHCGQHLGWTFERINSEAPDNSVDLNKFHGLIVTNILGENFTDSLIMMPQIYKSM